MSRWHWPGGPDKWPTAPDPHSVGVIRPPDPRETFIIGVDVGQANDYTAITILKPTTPDGADRPTYDMVHLDRWKDDPYPEQVRQMGALMERVKGEGEATLIVDATGVGKPILDELHEAKLRPVGVMITAGDRETREKGTYRVPKRTLVGHLQVALQSGRLRIPKHHRLARTLLEEFQGFRVKITASGHARFGNDVSDWREADHDDLVLATALSVWWGERRTPVPRATII